MLETGEVVHVIERRTFESDLRRHFVGTVESVGNSAFRASGYTFIFDSNTDRYVRSLERRTRVLPLGSSGIIINVVPPTTQVENVSYADKKGLLTVTDHADFNLTVNEFGPRY